MGQRERYRNGEANSENNSVRLGILREIRELENERNSDCGVQEELDNGESANA